MKKLKLHIECYTKGLFLLSLLVLSLVDSFASTTLNSTDNTSVFYSDEVIFIAKNAVLSVQTENVEIKKPIISNGVLHITHENEVAIIAGSNIQVENVIVENTILILKDNVEFLNLKLLNSNVELNDFNLFLYEALSLIGESDIIINGEGEFFILESQNTLNPILNVDFSQLKMNNVGYELKIEQNVKKIDFELKNEELNYFEFINIISPPPKF